MTDPHHPLPPETTSPMPPQAVPWWNTRLGKPHQNVSPHPYGETMRKTPPPRVIPEEKMCFRCKEVLPSSEFTQDPRVVSGLKSYCKKCCREDAAERLAKDRDRINARIRAYRKRTYTPERTRKRHILHKYKLSYDAYLALLASQGGQCAICRAEEAGGRGNWHVDHDHTTGAVRGLLCAKCNVGIAQFGDSPDLMLLAVAYLRERSTS